MPSLSYVMSGATWTVCVWVGEGICVCIFQPVFIYLVPLSPSSSGLFSSTGDVLVEERFGWKDLGGTWTPCWPWLLQLHCHKVIKFMCRMRLSGAIATSKFKLRLPLGYRCLMQGSCVHCSSFKWFGFIEAIPFSLHSGLFSASDLCISFSAPLYSLALVLHSCSFFHGSCSFISTHFGLLWDYLLSSASSMHYPVCELD